jgi:hypothetical protein
MGGGINPGKMVPLIRLKSLILREGGGEEGSRGKWRGSKERGMERGKGDWLLRNEGQGQENKKT